MISYKKDGGKYIVCNYDDGDLQTYYSTGGIRLSYEDMNKWNRENRLSRAYLDSRSYPAIEADLLSDGGITKENLKAFFKEFDNSVSSFREYIVMQALFKHAKTIDEDGHV